MSCGTLTPSVRLVSSRIRSWNFCRAFAAICRMGSASFETCGVPQVRPGPRQGEQHRLKEVGLAVSHVNANGAAPERTRQQDAQRRRARDRQEEGGEECARPDQPHLFIQAVPRKGFGWDYPGDFFDPVKIISPPIKLCRARPAIWPLLLRSFIALRLSAERVAAGPGRRRQLSCETVLGLGRSFTARGLITLA